MDGGVNYVPGHLACRPMRLLVCRADRDYDKRSNLGPGDDGSGNRARLTDNEVSGFGLCKRHGLQPFNLYPVREPHNGRPRNPMAIGVMEWRRIDLNPPSHILRRQYRLLKQSNVSIAAR